MAALFYRRLPRFNYLAPKTIREALKALAEYKDTAKLLAGGTDLIVQLKGIPKLDIISYSPRTGLKIGSLATVSALARSPVVGEHYPLLVEAALSMASPQVRNRGTFAGNICSAVPSADSAPSLMVLGAIVKIKGAAGERTVPMDRFFLGPRKTALSPDEMVTEIDVPKPVDQSRGVYLKLSPRHSMDLAIVGVAVAGVSEGGICKDVKIALGAVAPTPVRAPVAEDMLRDKKITRELIDEAARNAITQCSPIDDHRASLEYRCDMVYAMTKRALNQVFNP